MEKVKINRVGVLVTASNEGKGFAKSDSVEANLLFEILKKLEEIRCQGVDVESAVEGLKPSDISPR